MLHIRALREEKTHAAIVVFIASALPWCMWVCKIDMGTSKNSPPEQESAIIEAAK